MKKKLWFHALLIGVMPGVNAQKWSERPVTVSAGISLNPGLAVIQKEYEAGPVVSAFVPVWKQWDVGAIAFIRNNWYRAPDRDHGYKRNIHFLYDKENVYAIQLGYTTKSTRRWVHGFHIQPGIRLDRYAEKLEHPALGIHETFSLKENNLFVAASYSIRRRVSANQFVGLRWMLPFDRTPQDDINRHSLEFNWYFILNNKQ